MKLLTKEIIDRTPKTYANAEKDSVETMVTAKFFDPAGSFTWYLTELDDDKDYAFGFVTSQFCPEGELGYFSINELEETKGAFGLGIERDLHFQPKSLKEVMDSVGY